MNEMRITIQSILNTCTKLECGVPVPDDVIEKGKNYYGYEIQTTYAGGDLNNTYTMQASIVGRLVRKYDPEENTIEIVDEALTELLSKLKELNIKYSTQDVTLDNEVRKIVVSGYVIYNEKNHEFIIQEEDKWHTELAQVQS